MNTKGAMDSSSLMSLNGNSNTTNFDMNQDNSYNNQQNNYSQDNSYNNQQSNYSQQNNYNQQSNYNQGNNYSNQQNNYNQQSNYNQGNNYSNQQNNYNQGNNYSNQQNNYNNQQSGYTQGNNQSSNNYTPKRRQSGNGVHLKKGQKFALNGSNGSQLKSIRLGLGWDVMNQACDLDASAFMLDGQNRILNGDESWFVFYGQTTSPDGSVRHSGDSQGQGDGDDETIYINLDRVNQQVQRIAFVVTIDEALERGLNFSMIANAYVRILDDANGTELAKFNLTEYYSNVTAMVVGELYRHNGAWKFNPVGDGVAKDLAGLCDMYGVMVAD